MDVEGLAGVDDSRVDTSGGVGMEINDELQRNTLVSTRKSC